MPSETQIFEASRIALVKGTNLVEASAGTGKTFAIAMLALRCVAELSIPIEKLLIVTFTKAAAEELKVRIRARLTQARDLLQGQTGSFDQTLVDWAGSARNPELILTRLQLALYDIDRAGIFTIHSFCRRVLQEQALESGQLFDVELLGESETVRRQVVDDFWRTHVYTLAPLPCSVLTAVFPDPEALSASVRTEAAARIEPEPADLTAAVAVLDAAFARLACWWRRLGQDLYPLMAQGVAEQRFKSGFCEGFAAWWQRMSDCCSGATQELPENLHFLGRPGLLGELNGVRLRGEQKKRDFLAAWPLPEAEVADLLQAVRGLLLAFRAELAAVLGDQVEQRLQHHGAMSFNDLVLRLSRALKDGGADLRRILQERYRAALIDEFQDTDQAQWHIFSTLFGGGAHFLYLIGDPKQAVYRFRGADIFSYFEAKKSAGALLSLDRNYRSHPDLVDEVNRLFGARPQPFGFPESLLAYHPVVPARSLEDGVLLRGGQAAAAMVYCRLPEPEPKGGRWSSGRAAGQILQWTVHQVAELLDAGEPMLLATEKEGIRPVRPRDIAILVRSNRQAEDYRRALVGAMVPAVVASRQSVFATDACREMLRLLEAVAAPGDTLRLKAAMTSPWFGLPGAGLHAIWLDDACFDGWHSRFQDYYRLWREQGFLTMMNRLLACERVLQTLAAQPLAERHIANIHHLLELIQAAEREGNLGAGQVLQWLRTMMAGQGAEDIELRLESDEEAVRIVTMHSSKGLEYPIVFCPSLWQRVSRLAREKYAVTCHDGDSGLVTDLGSARFEERKRLATAEELAEELRLLYVAVTRAQLRCYVFWADVKPAGAVADSFTSALGYLLFPDGRLDYHGQQAVFAHLAGRPSVDCRLIDECSHNALAAPMTAASGTVLAPLQPSGRSLRTDWQMSSYSAMASLSDHDEQDHLVIRPPGDALPIACPGLPAGANFGNVVHNLLEVAPFSALAGEVDIGDHIARQCSRYGVKAEATGLRRLLKSVVTTPLSSAAGRDFTLAALAGDRCGREMPFYFHPDRIATHEINLILAADPAVSPLAPKVMQGYLTGFIDLVCEHQGKYYIIDYKTNFLGDLAMDYSPAGLVRAMAAHNYGLQYWIYTLVLHRHLENVLPDYWYERHFGGVFYLFVRGMMPAVAGSGVYFALPDKGILDRLGVCMEGRNGR